MVTEEKVVGLSRLSALDISGDGRRYFGGDQAWFCGTDSPKAKRMVKKGCSVTAAANMLAYLSAVDERCAPLCADMSRAGFTAYLCEVSEFLCPGIAGVWSAKRFVRGAKAFAASRGVALNADILRRFDADEAAEFIKRSLIADRPAAMLIGFNDTFRSTECTDPAGAKSDEKLTAHWVTVTELSETDGKCTATVSTWGKYARVDIKAYAENEKFMKALVSLYVK